MYSKEIRHTICEQLADGRSLREICRQPEMPCLSVVMKWLAEDADFSEQYARAREIGTEAHAEDLIDIADNSRNDWMERNGDDDTGWRLNGDNIQRAKLRIDTRKWLLARMSPKKYGDKVEQTIQGPNGQPVAMSLTVEFVKPPSADSTTA